MIDHRQIRQLERLLGPDAWAHEVLTVVIEGPRPDAKSVRWTLRSPGQPTRRVPASKMPQSLRRLTIPSDQPGCVVFSPELVQPLIEENARHRQAETDRQDRRAWKALTSKLGADLFDQRAHAPVPQRFIATWTSAVPSNVAIVTHRGKILVHSDSDLSVDPVKVWVGEVQHLLVDVSSPSQALDEARVQALDPVKVARLVSIVEARLLEEAVPAATSNAPTRLRL